MVMPYRPQPRPPPNRALTGTATLESTLDSLLLFVAEMAGTELAGTELAGRS